MDHSPLNPLFSFSFGVRLCPSEGERRIRIQRVGRSLKKGGSGIGGARSPLRRRFKVDEGGREGEGGTGTNLLFFSFPLPPFNTRLSFSVSVIKRRRKLPLLRPSEKNASQEEVQEARFVVVEDEEEAAAAGVALLQVGGGKDFEEEERGCVSRSL